AGMSNPSVSMTLKFPRSCAAVGSCDRMIWKRPDGDGTHLVAAESCASPRGARSSVAIDATTSIRRTPHCRNPTAGTPAVAADTCRHECPKTARIDAPAPPDCPDARCRRLLPGGPATRYPVRRLVLHGRAHDRDLLPTELLGQDPPAPQRGVPPDRSGSLASRVPGVPALPAGHDAGLAGVEPRRRRRSAGGAGYQRRRRRSRGRPGTRRPPGVLGATAAPPA